MSNVQRVVISETFGGFGLSQEGIERMRALGWDGKYDRDVERDDPRLVQVVEELGAGASGRYAQLAIVEIPAGIEWHVHEYDGNETVHEDHRSWTSDGLSDYC